MNSSSMNRRHGQWLKVLIVISTLLCGIYFIYIYNNANGKLKETERVAERYRREQESLRSQLQDLAANKDEQQRRAENEKQEFVNRLNTLNQHHKMLKSQHDDLEADYNKLQAEKEKTKEDNKLQEEQRNSEYQQLKQEKDLEISTLKDKLANLQREKEETDQQVIKLSQQLQDSQKQVAVDRNDRSNLEVEIANLKMQVKREISNSTGLHAANTELKNRLGFEQKSRNNLEFQIASLKEIIKKQQIQLLQAQRLAQQQPGGQIQQQGGQGQLQGQGQGQGIGQFNGQMGANQNLGNLPHQQQKADNLPQSDNKFNQIGFNNQANNNQEGQIKPINGVNKLSNQELNMGQVKNMAMDPADSEVKKHLGELHGGGGIKVDDKLMEHHQQQHQVQPPNLNKDDKLKPDSDGDLHKVDQKAASVNVSKDVVDKEQHLRQVPKPGGHDSINDPRQQSDGKEKLPGQVAQPGGSDHENRQIVPPGGLSNEQENGDQPGNQGAQHNQVIPPPGFKGDGSLSGAELKDKVVHQIRAPHPLNNEPENAKIKIGNEEHQQNLLPPNLNPDANGGVGGEVHEGPAKKASASNHNPEDKGGVGGEINEGQQQTLPPPNRY